MAEEAPKNNNAVVTVEEQEEVVVAEAHAAASSEDSAKGEESTQTKNVVGAEADEEEEEKEEVTSGVKTVSDVVAENSTVCEITADSNDELLFPETEMKALAELKELIRAALNNHDFTAASETSPPQPPPPQAEAEAEKTVQEEKTIEEEKTEGTHAHDGLVVEEAAAKVSVNEDGTKTVEAIEETVVSSVGVPGKEQTTPDVACNQESSAMGSSPVAESQQQEVKTTSESTQEESAPVLPPEEVSIWGVPLLKDERTDTILWKFLRARDFKVNEAFAMIKSTIKWRKEFNIDELLDEDLGDDLEKAVFMHGLSKEGHPVCYNVYGAFQDKGLYQKTFSDEEKRQKFLKWRIQFLEKSIRKLDFWPNGISTIVQVNDLKNSPGPGKRELRQATKQALQLLQDNYPEFVAKQVFVNVPWWYVAVNKMISPFLTQRTKSKFVVAGPSKSAETLFSYIAPEQVPVQYGGLSKTGEFGTKDGVTQIIVKPNSKENVEFAVTEASQLTWEVRVLGWEVSYGAEFVPNAKDAYTVIIQKMRKVGASEETIISNTFKTSEPGKVVLTIDNSSSKKKRLLYRLKSKPSPLD